MNMEFGGEPQGVDDNVSENEFENASTEQEKTFEYDEQLQELNTQELSPGDEINIVTTDSEGNPVKHEYVVITTAGQLSEYVFNTEDGERRRNRVIRGNSTVVKSVSAPEHSFMELPPNIKAGERLRMLCRRGVVKHPRDRRRSQNAERFLDNIDNLQVNKRNEEETKLGSIDIGAEYDHILTFLLTEGMILHIETENDTIYRLEIVENNNGAVTVKGDGEILPKEPITIESPQIAIGNPLILSRNGREGNTSALRSIKIL